ncbi:molybdopterin molybdotransferase MoeA [Halopseudomonas nanhaiensis]|uniref:molybdopterin molybdotransferase MoeA n=1 Tax=Halopseudomonas nanhaiensis TaxID=2830842 RepID=UPI001CC11D42|nr:gephyrin-like molybdotransferase Glp [Halopseudomonas nanhaiensis]UAW99335.1 molybdopterin molybdotransferase MoeA [Halopseudomonas nanhaiensis]
MKGCDCPDEPLMRIEDALEQMLARLPPLPSSETVQLAGAAGRVLADTLYSPVDVPAWDNSAMDGYALRAADWRAGIPLPLAGRVAAGEVAGALPPEHAVRIFTGAPLPAGADTVIAQEDCRVTDGQLWVESVGTGSHVRRRGEEMREGDLLLCAGTRLRPVDIGLLASRGIACVPVYKRLRVALVSSGDELREPGETLGPGQIHNANQPLLQALLTGWGCAIVSAEKLPDQAETTRIRLAELAGQADLVITSGGVSVGEEDHIKHAVRELGRLHLWRLAIQPGKPLAFGEVGGTPWIGLPGNPVAALITALMVARPWVWAAMGRTQKMPQPIVLPAGFDWHRPRPRRQFLRASLTGGAEGSVVMLHAQQGSAMLAAASWADGLVDIDPHGTFDAGAPVRFWPLSDLMH